MTRIVAGSSLFAILALFAAGLAGAQVNPGTPSWLPFDRHSIDTVNLQNLNISLNIPVWSKAGAFPVNASYTTNFYLWADGPNLFSAGGELAGTVNNVLLDAFVSFTTFTYDVACPNGGTTDKYPGWYLQTADGTVHNLPASVYADSAGCLAGSGFTAQVIDGTGWTVSESANASSSGESVYASNGTIWNRYNHTLTDANGNSIFFTNNNYVFPVTDTLGLTAVTLNGLNAYGSIQWTSPSGGTVSTTQTLAGLNERSVFGCPVGDYYDQGADLATAITLGDGTTVDLSYEPTPNNAGYYPGR